MLCSLLAFLICTKLVTPKYKTEGRIKVSGNHYPEEYYDLLIEGNRMDLVNELKEYIHGEETYALAARYAGTTAETIKRAVNVFNDKEGLDNEYLTITVFEADAHLTQGIYNAYTHALMDVLHPFADGECDCFVHEAPLPLIPASPPTILITLITGASAAVIAFILFSKLRLFDSICILFFTACILVCFFPFYYLFINTISNNNLAAQGAIKFLPRGIHFQNYIDLFRNKENDLFNALFTTMARTIIGTGIMVFVSGWAGYLFTRKKLWKRTFWYRALIITMFFNSGLIPWYMNMEMLGLKGSFLAYILPGIVVPYNIILVKKYIESIPVSLEEAAMIDGAGTSRMFFSIIWPMISPVLIVIAFFGVLSNWNSFQDSLLLMAEKPELQTLQHYLYNTIRDGSKNVAETGAFTTGSIESGNGAIHLYTLSMVTLLPVFLIYPFILRFFGKGIITVSLKH